MLVDARWGLDSKTQESHVTHPDFKDLFPYQRSSISKDLLFQKPWDDLEEALHTLGNDTQGLEFNGFFFSYLFCFL